MPVHVRDAEERDAAVLARLWRELVVRPGSDPGVRSPEDLAVDAVARLRDDKEARLVVAELDGRVVGGAFLRLALVSPLHREEAVHLSHLQVDPRFTRQGVGSSIVEAALSWADELGVGSLLAATSAADRETNRFLARLGFAQMAVLRAGSVAAVRSRLHQDLSVAVRGSARRGRSVGRVVAARRSQRRARGQDAVT